jgi:hypothetical protein
VNWMAMVLMCFVVSLSSCGGAGSGLPNAFSDSGNSEGVSEGDTTPVVLTAGSSHNGVVEGLIGYSVYKFSNSAAGSATVTISNFTPAGSNVWVSVTEGTDNGPELSHGTTDSTNIVNGTYTLPVNQMKANTDYYITVGSATQNIGFAQQTYIITITPN